MPAPIFNHLLRAETPQQVDNFLEPWLIATTWAKKQVHEWKRHKNPKKSKKKAKNIYKNVHETDIINMSESVTLWILRIFNSRINWLSEWTNERVEWVAWVQANEWIEKNLNIFKKLKQSDGNRQSPIANWQSSITSHMTSSSSSAWQAETKQNPEPRTERVRKRTDSEIEVKSVKKTEEKHAQN